MAEDYKKAYEDAMKNSVGATPAPGPTTGGAMNQTIRKEQEEEAKKKAEKEKKSTSDKSDKKPDMSTPDARNTEGKLNNSGQLKIAFAGRMSAEIIRSVINTFIFTNVQAQVGSSNDVGATSLLYEYNMPSANDTKTVRDLLNVYIPDERGMEYIKEGRNVFNYYDPDNGYYGKVFNPDESMMPNPTKYLGWNGSILSMIQSLANKPFNELFWTHEEGKATLHYRQTPFEKQDWDTIDSVYINMDDVISLDVDSTDQEQYSIFKLISSTGLSGSPFENGYPLTDDRQELMARYGYKTLEVETEYFDNSASADSEVTDDYTGETVATGKDKWEASKEQEGSEDEATASKFYPPFGVVNMYPNIDTAGMWTADGKKQTDYINNHYSIDDYYGGQELYNSILKFLNDNKIMPQQGKIDGLNQLISDYFTNKGATNTLGQQAGKNIDSIWEANASLTKYTYVTQILPEQANPFPPAASQAGYGTLYYVLGDASERKKHPVQAAADIVTLSRGRIGSQQAAAIVEAMNNGTWNSTMYQHIMSQIRHDAVDKSVATAKNANGPANVYMRYQQKLFNWYADSAKMYSGTIVTTGRVDVEYGKKLYLTDSHRGQYWEFYIEGVDHNFDFSSGWTTSIIVTRGLMLKNSSDDLRFRMFWGHYTLFTGNFFGEDLLASFVSEAVSNGSSDSSESEGGSGPNVGAKGKVKDAIKEAKDWASKKGTYSQANHANNIYNQNGTPKTDCSGFVYDIMNHVGLNFDSPYETTTVMRSDSHFTTVSKHGSNKEKAFKDLHNGDLIFWDTDGVDGHVGIYVGNGKAIAWNGNGEGDSSSTAGPQEFNMKDSYWWSVFSGHVIRAKNGGGD